MFCGFGALNDASLDSSSFISNQSLDQGSSKGQQVKLAGGGQFVASGGQSDVNQNEGEKDGRSGADGGPGLGTTSKEIDQHRAIQFQKSAFNAQVENRLDDAISNYKKLLETDFRKLAVMQIIFLKKVLAVPTSTTNAVVLLD